MRETKKTKRHSQQARSDPTNQPEPLALPRPHPASCPCPPVSQSPRPARLPGKAKRPASPALGWVGGGAAVTARSHRVGYESRWDVCAIVTHLVSKPQRTPNKLCGKLGKKGRCSLKHPAYSHSRGNSFLESPLLHQTPSTAKAWIAAPQGSRAGREGHSAGPAGGLRWCGNGTGRYIE